MRRLHRILMLGSAIALGLLLPLLMVTAGAKQPSTPSASDISSESGSVPSDVAAATQSWDYPYQDPSLPVAARVNDLLSRMTLAEKVGQMTLVPKKWVDPPYNMITDDYIGSAIIFSLEAGNVPENWADMYDHYQSLALSTRLGIPLISGIDAVHGHSWVYSATIFPHNIGMGATRNPVLAEEAARITAIEVAATGFDWTFGPCVAVARDERWGRTYESFGEVPDVPAMMTTMVAGYQGIDLSDRDTILATAKHYVGDGGTTWGTGVDFGIDRGDTQVSTATLRAIHLAPYEDAITAGVGSIMISYSKWNGQSMHFHTYLISDVLRTELGFDGIIVSDWAGLHETHIEGPLPSDYDVRVRTAINAGIDMVTEPWHPEAFITTVISEVKAGNIPMARIDDAVTRILTKKFELGLFERPYVNRTNLGLIGSAAHRDVARQAVRESLVLLKNKGDLLPLDKTVETIYVTGSNADNIGYQSGGWTISWQGGSGDITPGTSILEGIDLIASPATVVTYEHPPVTPAGDVGIVVVGEAPYAEFEGDSPELTLTLTDTEAVETVCSAMDCVVVLVSGRPMSVTTQIEQADAFVAAWLPGTEGHGVAEVLFGDYNFTGKLPMSWPANMAQIPINYGDSPYNPLFEYGYGLSYPWLDFSSPFYTVSEGGTAVISVTLNATATAPISVSYSASGGRATPGSDYVTTTGTLTFAAGSPPQSTQVFTVATLDDSEAEVNETVELTLFNASGIKSGSPALLAIQDDGDAPVDDQVTLTWYVRDGPSERPWEEDMRLRYQSSHPTITVEIITATWDEFAPRLNGLWLQGSPPDVWSPNHSTNGFKHALRKGWLADLSPHITGTHPLDVSDFYTETIDMYTMNGRVYGLPILSGGSFVFYNKAMFDAAGVAYPPTDWDDASWTWDAMVSKSISLTTDYGQPDTVVYGVDAGLSLPWDAYPWLWGQGLFPPSAYQTGLASESYLDTLTATLAYQARQDLICTHQVSPWPDEELRLGGWYGQVFLNQRAAMVATGLWGFPTFKDASFDWGFAALPRGTPGAKDVVYTDPWSMSSATQHPGETWEFVRFLVSWEAQRAYMQATDYPPVRQSLMAEWGEAFSATMTLTQTREVYAGALAHGHESPNHLLVDYDQIHAVLEEELAPLWSNCGVSATVTLSNADARLEATLAWINVQNTVPTLPLAAGTGGSVSTPDGVATLDFGAGSVSETTVISVTSEEAILESPGLDSAGSVVHVVAAVSDTGQVVTQTNVPYTMSVTYDLDGGAVPDVALTVVAAEARTPQEGSLALYWWNPVSRVWEMEASSQVDTVANVIQARPTRFGLFAVFGKPSVYLPLVIRDS